MPDKKFSYEVSYQIIHAQAAIVNQQFPQLCEEALAIGVLNTGKNTVTSILLKQGVDLEKCLKKLKAMLGKKTISKDDKGSTVSPKVGQIRESAREISKGLIKSKEVGLIHMFLAILQESSEIKDVFTKSGMDLNAFIKDAKKSYKSGATKKQAKSEKDTSSSKLEEMCVNMTEQAANNKFDPIIARDDEIEEAITILCRRNKSNPILVGEPGVGKTAIVEGICQRIASQTVPKKLRDTQIHALNMSSLVAGTKYRGEFEKRLEDLLEEVREAGNVVLFLDEVHNIVGAGSASGSMDAANILKPELARSLSCIGATTQSEYKRIFQEDGALDRRFEKVTVEEPSKEQTIQIIQGVKERFEAFHECVITDDAVEMAVSLTDRFCSAKNFPDKALDCIDTACAKFAWEDDISKKSITGNDIAMVISKQSQVPLEVILIDNYERILNTETHLRKRIVGQDHVIDSFCRSLKNAYSGVRDPNKPIGSFIFGGETGVGKTYACKEIAIALFGKESSFIRLDMTEYSETHSISKIIGSPPGYVGFKTVDTVSDKIKRKPYSVVLLDEFDKADPSVMKLFLQVMSDGFFTDAQGCKIDCRNTIIIMTGNFGMNKQEKGSIGFFDKPNSIIETKEKKRLIKFCNDAYGEEFSNRVDDFLVFSSLDKDALVKISSLRLMEFIGRIVQKGTSISFGQDVSARIVELSANEHGRNANMVNRVISKHIEPLIADALLKAQSEKDKKHYLTIVTKGCGFSVRTRRKAK